MPEGLDTTAKEHQGRTITPDAGLLHILALLKRGSWLLVKEKIETMILVPNDEANISKNRSEDEPVISNTVRKLSFITPHVEVTLPPPVK